MITGFHQIMVKILYGSGLRAIECLRLRVKDLDFDMNEIMVRDGKGKKDRVTILPDDIKDPLQKHLTFVKQLKVEEPFAAHWTNMNHHEP